MMFTHAGSLPRHQYVLVEPDAIGRHGWLQAVWFGITSYPGRAWGCHVLLECGAIYRNVPLHKLAMRETEVPWSAAAAQTWDAYGWQFSTIEYPFLMSNNVRVRLRDKRELSGEYLFTAVPVADAFSASPAQSKEFMFCALANGRLTAQPTNHVLVEDRSFTTTIEWPKFLQRQNDWHSSEE